MSELFPEDSVKQDSPRLAWMKKHNIKICSVTHEVIDPEIKFMAWKDELPEDVGDYGNFVGYGETEHHAIFSLCCILGLKSWGEA